MKKINLAALLILSTFLISGCTKNYATVSEYSNAMNIIKNKNTSYVIEAKQSINNSDIYYRTYVKGDKWKTEGSLNGGNSYGETILYDGIDLLTYTAGSKYAIVNPMMEVYRNDTQKERILAINSANPLNVLINWQDNYNMFSGLKKTNPEFINQNDKRNGFSCRMIKLEENREACISDKYGIAVYQKMKIKSLRGKEQEIITNLVKIEIKDNPNSTFDLPQGVKKSSFESVLNNLTNSLKNF